MDRAAGLFIAKQLAACGHDEKREVAQVGIPFFSRYQSRSEQGAGCNSRLALLAADPPDNLNKPEKRTAA